MTIPDSFTIRVYGLLIHNKQVLLSREIIKGDVYTKFPGGGLEYGEGVIDCLNREFMEETGIHLTRWELFHTNESYLPSQFHESKQVIVIYYRVWADEPGTIQTGNPGSLSSPKNNSNQVLYWCDLEKLNEELLNLGADQ